MKWGYRAVTALLLAATAVVSTYHAGTVPPRPAPSDLAPAKGWFAPRRGPDEIHQLVVEGNSRARGRYVGRATATLLAAQEGELQRQLRHAIPWAVAQRGLELFLMRWFSGIEEYIDERELDEMAGVGESAPHAYDFLADGFTRQVAYHGIHEVGQLFVDVGGADMGCTVFAVPGTSGWTVGRNFDFEGGRIFDEEKILKWVFPERGLAYVSIIWAGMVGAVTGVNQNGVYVSINAAGSTDFRRLGTPTTLVAARMLGAAQNAEEAVQILSAATTFITDIFVVADRDKAYRVEKSPDRVLVHRLELPTVVANHLVDPAWADDRINALRKTKLTTLAREARGNELLAGYRKDVPAPEQLLRFLRDKGRGPHGRLPLGHRSAIDALIATHAAIYDSGRGSLWVSTGPSLAGAFLGYDLAASFREHRPVTIPPLPADPDVTREGYRAVKTMASQVAEAERLLAQKDCDGAGVLLDRWREHPERSYDYWTARGDWHRCRQEPGKAREAWTKAQALVPAYSWERAGLEERLR